ncbi:adenosylcobinamide-phosphate synthase CbiB [Propylenella binzhouense]|uniref:Cobalamin biosynthesis protein CobD n=1 Tax=Propylenella binzhouense TaxID=2555902 RepID=A0A964T3U7_9HYPH|nr:adenosylcobinamide-phosphate synthase CbiB [Propylenella binzhouense]MYZ47710.1 cobalamin biosynthesis protein [Propylenella binzhouense]
MTVPEHLAVLAAALVLDRLVGDPGWLWNRLPHPVVLAGRLIGRLDAALNRPTHSFRTRRVAGVAALAVLAGLSVAAGLILDRILSAVSGGAVVEALVVAIFLAQKSLLDHVRAVARALRDGGLAAARQAVSMIVGRDVARLDAAGVARAAIESLAENFSDGVVAPAFWYGLLGLPGLFLFKAANTADSMIGHRSERHAAFGWAAARLDDLLNLVPARLTAALIALAAALGGNGLAAAIRAAWRDAPRHRSPNAGWPEAAMAGALGLALGGPRRYGTEIVDGAWLGEGGRTEAGPQDVRAALRVTDLAWSLGLALVASLAILAG